MNQWKNELLVNVKSVPRYHSADMDMSANKIGNVLVLQGGSLGLMQATNISAIDITEIKCKKEVTNMIQIFTNLDTLVELTKDIPLNIEIK